jgi:hypothetical protein
VITEVKRAFEGACKKWSQWTDGQMGFGGSGFGANVGFVAGDPGNICTNSWRQNSPLPPHHLLHERFARPARIHRHPWIDGHVSDLFGELTDEHAVHPALELLSSLLA